MNNDIWYIKLNEQLSKSKKKKFYSSIAQERWKIAIDKIIEDLPNNSNILKTDGWNEAVGRGLIDKYRNIYNFHICDISKNIIRKIKKEFPNSFVMDIKNLDFPDNYFDLILDISTSDHCSSEALPGIIASYSCLLNKNGRLLLIHNSRKCLIWRFLDLLGKKSPAFIGNAPTYYFNPNYVKGLLEKSFIINDMRCTNLFSWAKPILNTLPINNSKIIHFFAKIELEVNHKLFSLLGRQYVFFCEKKEF